MDRGSLEELLGRGLSLEQIGKRFGKHPSTVSYWIAKYGLEAANREKHTARGGLARDELEALVLAGLSITEMAEVLGLSKGSVRHWLRRHRLQTRNATRREEHRKAKSAGLMAATLRCRVHGETEFVIDSSGVYRCRQCRVDAVVGRRRRVKRTLVDEAGGRCVVCGYDRYVGALEFHHLDPEQKTLAISTNGITLALEALRAEAAKCVLLCSNCHAEVEGGVTLLPIE